MFHLNRIAVGGLARQLLPATGAHRHRPPDVRLLPQPRPVERPLQSRRPDPYGWPDDGLLIRPYVLDDEEWGRRREGQPQAVGTAP